MGLLLLRAEIFRLYDKSVPSRLYMDIYLSVLFPHLARSVACALVPSRALAAIANYIITSIKGVHDTMMNIIPSCVSSRTPLDQPNAASHVRVFSHPSFIVLLEPSCNCAKTVYTNSFK